MPRYYAKGEARGGLGTKEEVQRFSGTMNLQGGEVAGKGKSMKRSRVFLPAASEYERLSREVV